MEAGEGTLSGRILLLYSVWASGSNQYCRVVLQPYRHDAIVSALTQSTMHVQDSDHKCDAMSWTLTFGQRSLSTAHWQCHTVGGSPLWG